MGSCTEFKLSLPYKFTCPSLFLEYQTERHISIPAFSLTQLTAILLLSRKYLSFPLSYSLLPTSVSPECFWNHSQKAGLGSWVSLWIDSKPAHFWAALETRICESRCSTHYWHLDTYINASPLLYMKDRGKETHMGYGEGRHWFLMSLSLWIKPYMKSEHGWTL